MPTVSFRNAKDLLPCVVKAGARIFTCAYLPSGVLARSSRPPPAPSCRAPWPSAPALSPTSSTLASWRRGCTPLSSTLAGARPAGSACSGGLPPQARAAQDLQSIRGSKVLGCLFQRLQLSNEDCHHGIVYCSPQNIIPSVEVSCAPSKYIMVCQMYDGVPVK